MHHTKAARAEGSPTFRSELLRIDDDLRALRELCEREDASPGHFARAAESWLARARLSGSLSDYAASERSLNRAFAATAEAPNGPGAAGPLMIRARLNHSLHRIDRIDSDLQLALSRPADSPEERASRLAFAASVALERGEYARARTGYDDALRVAETPTVLFGSAALAHATGEFAAAEHRIKAGLVAYGSNHGEPVAWAHFQLGLMDLERGRYDAALAHYRDAERRLPGYWRIEEHIAEVMALRGDHEGAMERYGELIERTENPEFMDAMAKLLRAHGRDREALGYVQRARARYDAAAVEFPETMYGHALAHALEFASDPALALTLAKRNHALRPNAQAKIGLARAYLRADDPDGAATVISEALQSGARSAALHAVAADVFAALGDPERTSVQQVLARAINPDVEFAR